MPTCLATYTSNHLPPGPGCENDCTGVSYTVLNVNSAFANGKCDFTYTVKREPDGKEFTGSETLNCPSSKTLTFYCDDEEECAIFVVVLKCIAEGPPG